MDTRIILFAAGALMMAACSSNDPEVQGATNEIRLYTEVTAQTRAEENPTALQDAQFAANTDISVMVTDMTTVGTPVDYETQTYRADGYGGLIAMTKQYYPPSGSNVDVFAYHPACDPASLSDFSVASDQRALGDYRVSDLMCAKLEGINKNTPAADRVLHFSHLCSKIVVRLVKGNGVTDAELNAASITLGDSEDKIVMGGTFDVNTGELTPNAEATGTLLIATNASTTWHAAVVVPQTMVQVPLTVALSENAKKSYAITGTFMPGKKYVYTVTVNKAELVVTATIDDWTTPDGWEDPTPNLKI